jgi:hypothetical protein
MQEDIDFDEIISNYKTDPYHYVDIVTAHTGRIQFKVGADTPVEGLTGEWRHIPGTVLYEIERERNVKPFHSKITGLIADIRTDLDNQFVEAGEKVMTIRYPLKKREIIDTILKKVLTVFCAPERAKYFFSLDIQAKIEKLGQRSVSVKPGEEFLTMSLMKRDTPVYYEGKPGIIHSVYFTSGDSINQGDPMVGICSEEMLPLIQRIINRVKAEWD